MIFIQNHNWSDFESRDEDHCHVHMSAEKLVSCEHNHMQFVLNITSFAKMQSVIVHNIVNQLI